MPEDEGRTGGGHSTPAVTEDLRDIGLREGWIDPESRDGRAMISRFVPAQLFNRANILPPPHEWLVDQWIPRVGLTNFSGHGESGKTYLLLDLMICSLLGRKWLGLKTTEVNSVCFLTGEQTLDQIDLRLDRLLARYGFDGSGHEGSDGRRRPRVHFHEEWLKPRGKTFNYWSTVVDEVDIPFVIYERFPKPGEPPQYVSDYWISIQNELFESHCELFGIDTVGHFYHENISDKPKVLWFLKELNRTCQEAHLSIVFLFHPTLTGIIAESGPVEGMGGCMEWHTQVDGRLLLRYDEDTDERLLRQKKIREGPRQGDIKLKWDGHGFTNMAPEDMIDGYKIALSIIRHANDSGLLLSPDYKSRSYYPRLMWSHPLNRDGRRRIITNKNREAAYEQFENLVVELLRRGDVVIGDVRTSTRHLHRGLILAPQDAEENGHDAPSSGGHSGNILL